MRERGVVAADKFNYQSVELNWYARMAATCLKVFYGGNDGGRKKVNVYKWDSKIYKARDLPSFSRVCIDCISFVCPPRKEQFY